MYISRLATLYLDQPIHRGQDADPSRTYQVCKYETGIFV